LDINLPPANEQQGSAQSNVVYSNAANVASTQKKKRTDVVFATATPLQAAPVSVKPAAPRLSVTDAPVRQATTNTPLIPERPAPTPNADRSSHATATGLQVQYIQIPRKYYPWYFRLLITIPQIVF
jgi:hypothetical protein